MSRTPYRRFGYRISGLVVWLFFALLSSCQPLKTVPAYKPAPPGMEKLLVIPFTDMSEVYGVNVQARCPVCHLFFITGKIPKGTDDALTEQLMMQLKTHTGFHLIPPGQAEGVRTKLLSLHRRELVEKNLIIEIGRKIGADAVMSGHIWRFTERIGASYAADSPASVAFDLHIVQVRTGEVIWCGHFDETQKALTQNLFNLDTFLKRGGQWITAMEMAAAGLEDVIKTIPTP